MYILLKKKEIVIFHLPRKLFHVLWSKFKPLATPQINHSSDIYSH